MITNVVDRIRSFIAKSKDIPLELVTIDSTFEDLGMDSLDRINLLFAIEEDFNISIPDEEVQSIRSVREVVAGVETLLSGTDEANVQDGR